MSVVLLVSVALLLVLVDSCWRRSRCCWMWLRCCGSWLWCCWMDAGVGHCLVVVLLVGHPGRAGAGCWLVVVLLGLLAALQVPV